MVQIVHARRPLARKAARAGLTPLGPDQFEGYASLFNLADGAGDTVAPGAFAASLRRRGPAQVRLCISTSPMPRSGCGRRSPRTGAGFMCAGRLVPEVEQARDVRALLAEGALSGLSIGFRTVRAKRGASPRHPAAAARRGWHSYHNYLRHSQQNVPFGLKIFQIHYSVPRALGSQ